MLEDNTEYRSLIEKLLYPTITGPDICCTVQQLSQYLDKPIVHHFKAIHRVYVNGTQNQNQGLKFSSNTYLQLSSFSDSDLVGCSETRKSITVSVFSFGVL